MAKPEQCSHCTKPATIHLTQILNNKIQKVDLCEDCPFKKGVTDPKGFSLVDFLMKEPETIGNADGDKCPSCGMTPSDFKKHGRFGCPDCYAAFAAALTPMLANMHKGVVHRGKVPEAAKARVCLQRELDALQSDLDTAIAHENYERAAELRDAIKDLKATAAGEGV